jgi:multicomponent Na+:H+ antiporter subunit D
MFLNLGTIIVFIKYSAMLFGQPLPGANTEDQFIRKYEVGIGKKTAILIPGALCFAGGVFGEQVIHFLFNVRVTVDAGGYGEKALIFGLSAAAGFLIFSYLGKCGKALMVIKRIDPGFREICVLLGLFFAVVLIVSRISVS